MTEPFKKIITVICCLICISTCTNLCKGQGKYDDLPSKHPPWGFEDDTCILAALDAEYYVYGYLEVRNPEILNVADSLIDKYYSICGQEQISFLKYEFMICMFTRQYDNGIQFIVDHPANEEYEWDSDLLVREFYITTLLGAKYLKSNDLSSFDSINRALLQKFEECIIVQSDLRGDNTLPVSRMAQKHFSELRDPKLDYLIMNYYLLRARTEDINVVLSELYDCMKLYPDQSSIGYYKLLGLIKIIEEMSQKTYHFEYEL